MHWHQVIKNKIWTETFSTNLEQLTCRQSWRDLRCFASKQFWWNCLALYPDRESVFVSQLFWCKPMSYSALQLDETRLGEVRNKQEACFAANPVCVQSFSNQTSKLPAVALHSFMRSSCSKCSTSHTNSRKNLCENHINFRKLYM